MVEQPLPAGSSPDEERIQYLAARHVEGVLDAAELAELDALLQEDPRLMRVFYRTHLLARNLEECSRAWLRDMPREAQQSSPQKITSNGATILCTAYWRAHPARFAALALALTLLFWVGVAYVVVPRLRDGGSGPNHGADYVAQITKLHNAEWAAGTEVYSLDDSLVADDLLDLASGLVEIKFSDGAVVLLEGPAQFQVDSRGAGTLQVGRLVARIHEKHDRQEAGFFAIFTPLAGIIDLGTEFGVEVAGDGTTHVEVLEGRVEATARGEAKTRASRPLRLDQGQSALFLPGNGGLQLENSDRQFVRNLPEDAGDLRGYPVVNYRRVKMATAGDGSENIGVYSAHTTRQENTLLKFDLNSLAGAKAAGSGRLTFTVLGGHGAMDPGSFELELRQLNSYNAAVDLDTADSYFLDGVSARWRDNSGAEMDDLGHSNAVLDITSGLVAMRKGPFAGDTPSTDPPPGSQIVFTIPRATLQSWLDQTAPPILVITAHTKLASADGTGRIETTRVDDLIFGSGGTQPLPVLKFEVVDPAEETATDGELN